MLLSALMLIFVLSMQTFTTEYQNYQTLTHFDTELESDLIIHIKWLKNIVLIQNHTFRIVLQSIKTGTQMIFLKTVSETILNPMLSQISFKRNADGSYANLIRHLNKRKWPVCLEWTSRSFPYMKPPYWWIWIGAINYGWFFAESMLYYMKLPNW